MTRLIGLMIAVLAASPLRAELIHSSDDRFLVQHSISTPATPNVVYDIMTEQINHWWNGDHSWSRNAGNLYLDTDQQRCFCEHLPNGGFVEHLRLIYLAPGKELRFEGALGPLQQMAVEGRMTWKIEAGESGSTVTFRYLVFGHATGGLSGIAAAVDGVIGEQLDRLASRLSEY